MLTIAAYVADVAILGSYAWLTRTGRARWFHWSNAIGSVPICAVEIVTGAWPALILTAVFGVLGVAGIVRDRQAVAA